MAKDPGVAKSTSGSPWSDGTEAGTTVRQAQYSELLAEHLTTFGLVPDLELWPGIADEIRQHGTAEWKAIAGRCPTGIEEAKAKKLLGSGYVVTVFLLQAAGIGHSAAAPFASAGALFNLAVVACDRLLERGLPVCNVIPSFQAGLMESDRPVDALMYRYRALLTNLQLPDPLRLAIDKAIGRIFEAEVQTVRLGSDLPFRFWLRKSAVPFVLMGLPACTGRRYLAWLYRLGRFWGAVDDVADYAEDMEANEPNLLRRLTEEQRLAFLARLASRGAQVLAEWDSLVPRTNGFAAGRESFLYFIWNWIGGAPAVCAGP